MSRCIPDHPRQLLRNGLAMRGAISDPKPNMNSSACRKGLDGFAPQLQYEDAASSLIESEAESINRERNKQMGE